MKIILIKDVKKVGRKYEIKDVADGYAMNALIPYGKALPATPGNIKSVTAKKETDTLLRKDFEEALNYAVGKLKDNKLHIVGKVNDKGNLFAGIHKEQIIEEFKKETGVEIPMDAFELDKPLKEVGEHEIELRLEDKKVKIKVLVKAE